MIGHGDSPPHDRTKPDWLAAAVACANVPTLACVLVHLTGERRWIAPPYAPSRTRGLEDNDDGGLPIVVQEEVRSAAMAAIGRWLEGEPPALIDPGDALLVEMMSVSLGERIPADYAPMIRNELQLVQPACGEATTSHDLSALIIGAGISGLCAAIELTAAEIPCRIVERRPDLGGVWFENRYPGAACDVPSHLYSFSFAPFEWSRFFADSSEIHRYLGEVADAHELRRLIDFDTEVIEARWSEADLRWQVDVATADGEQRTLTAPIVISAVGAFNKPRMPAVPGLERFTGPSVHTARYPDTGLDLKNKHVVLVGNGASAMQVGPAIADEVASLTVVQRTPQWAAPFPKFKEAIAPSLRRLLATVPLYRLWYRLRLSWALNDKTYEALRQDPDWQGEGRSINAINDAHRAGLTAYITAELGEAQHLLPAVLPAYPPFGKRMLLDNGWFRTLARDHVVHVDGSVVEVVEAGVVTSDGTTRHADAIIWATGFDVVNLLAPMRVKGIDGRDLHDEWDGDDARAFLGATMPGFPNLFCLYDPNTQFGHGGSLITVLERQMHYVMSLLRQMIERRIAAVEIRRDVHDSYNRAVDETHAGMVWTYPGVESYYKNSKGRIVVNNPFRILDVWRMTETARLDDYLLTPRHAGIAA